MPTVYVISEKNKNRRLLELVYPELTDPNAPESSRWHWPELKVGPSQIDGCEMNGLYPRDSEEKLLRAFRTLDPDNKGYVEAEKVRTLLTTHGERFSQEEIDDFLNFAVDADSGLLHYEDYVNACAP